MLKNLLAPIFVCFLLFSFAMLQAQSVKVELPANWTFRQVNKDQWYPAKVPGTVHTDLLFSKQIDDPFYRTYF